MSFDCKVIPSLNKALVLELARCEYIERRENLIALSNSGTGKTHIALGHRPGGLPEGRSSVGFITAAAMVHDLLEACDDKQLLRLQKKLVTYKLLIVDELGFVPLSKTGGELLFSMSVSANATSRDLTLVTTNRALRRMDRRVRLRAPHRRTARSPHPPRRHPRDER